MQTTIIPIEGMHCMGCVSNIEGVLKALPGVSRAAVTLTPAQAEVSFDPAQVDRASLITAIEDAGFDAC